MTLKLLGLLLFELLPKEPTSLLMLSEEEIGAGLVLKEQFSLQLEQHKEKL